MKQITITVPDNCELKQDGNTYTIVEKENKLTYEDVARKVFKNCCYYIDYDGSIIDAVSFSNEAYNSTSCVTRRQAEKLLAINKLMNVAKYLNGSWQPDWENSKEIKYTIAYDYRNNIFISDISSITYTWGIVHFKSAKLAKQAIEILGEDTIKLALCTDY